MAPKSKTPGCLERSISAFQAMYPNPDPPDDRDEVFRALRAHPGVEAEWEKIAPPRDDGLVDAIPNGRYSVDSSDLDTIAEIIGMTVAA